MSTTTTAATTTTITIITKQNMKFLHKFNFHEFRKFASHMKFLCAFN